MGAMVVVVTQGVVAHISNAQRPPSYLKNFYGSFFDKNVKLRLNQSMVIDQKSNAIALEILTQKSN